MTIFCGACALPAGYSRLQTHTQILNNYRCSIATSVALRAPKFYIHSYYGCLLSFCTKYIYVYNRIWTPTLLDNTYQNLYFILPRASDCPIRYSSLFLSWNPCVYQAYKDRKANSTWQTTDIRKKMTLYKSKPRHGLLMFYVVWRPAGVTASSIFFWRFADRASQYIYVSN